MSPAAPPDLSPLEDRRRQLQELVGSLRALDQRLAKRRAELAAALRAGASPNVTIPLQEAIREDETARRQRQLHRRELQAAIDRLVDGLLGELDPARMLESLDGGQPIALLPMRLETRYLPPGERSTLRIRVYPDDLNTIEHTPAPTGDELRGATEYWEARFRGDDTDAERVARDLAMGFGRGRTAWLLRITTPDNIDRLGQDGERPVLPPLETIEAKSKETRAVVLPDRWCAIGFAAGRREVLRVWGRRIPDELLLSPDWLAQDPEPLLGGERAWLVDFQAALDKGMALEVTQAQLEGRGFNLATDTLERLIVVGVDWTRDAQGSSERLADLLAAQRDSRGLGFVPLGTPTNNTEANPSGYSPVEESAAPPTPSESAALPKEKDAAELLRHAFGLAASDPSLDGVTNAHLPEQRTALHMMNVLWRGTFGQYLMEMWNPGFGDEKDWLIKTSTLYALRSYAVAYLRPGGPLPLLRVNKQPYGVLPVVGKRFEDGSDTAVVRGIGKVLRVLRPMFELAARDVPRLEDGDVEQAAKILQTAPWSQTAYYRDKEAGKAMCPSPSVFGDAQSSGKRQVIDTILAALGVSDEDHWKIHLYGCNDFLPDPPYHPGYLAGVPWVLGDTQDPTREAPDGSTFPKDENYLQQIAKLLTEAPSKADLHGHQRGPALLQALVAYSVQEEQGDAVETTALRSNAISKVASLATPKMPYVEEVPHNEAIFTVTTPKELARVSIPAVTGRATLGEHVASSLALQAQAPPPDQGSATMAARKLRDAVAFLAPEVRDLGAVTLSLQYLAERPVGELNVAFRTTLDAFSYRLDAWLTARASRRLEQLRDAKPAGVHVGGFAWVENLRPDGRPDSDGHLLAPSLGQAATAALLRSGFLANHEQGAFNIDLDSRRTRRAEDILQGLTRDQPLAALYGYRVERALRDAKLGKLIWPLRRAYPWRPAGDNLGDEPAEAVGARDVVDGVALLAELEADANKVKTRLSEALGKLDPPQPALDAADWTSAAAIFTDALDLADSVADLLLAEGMHQIVQGNFERAGAAMAVADKQQLPIEPQVARTPRGGASYTQRVVVMCPRGDGDGWPQDRRSAAEPALNAWLAHMLGDPSRFRFAASVHRGVDGGGQPIVDADPVVVSLKELGLSPLSGVLLATTLSGAGGVGQAETGFRARLVAAFIARIADAGAVTGLDIAQEGATPQSLGLGHFEALAMTLRSMIDKARPATRKDLVLPDDSLERSQPQQGEYPGVDLGELRDRATTLIDEFVAVKTMLDGSAGADALLAAVAASEDFLPRAAWPQEVLAIDAPGADPAERDARADVARAALAALTGARLEAVNAPPELLEDQAAATHGQLAAHAIEQIKRLLGKDFPVLPRFSVGPYASELAASLAEQQALTLDNPWQVTEWIPKLARVREGLERFSSALLAREALVDLGAAGDFKLAQWPHRHGQVWAALPEAWREPEGTPADPTQVPEELADYLASVPGPAYRNLQRAAPNLALALHAPGGLETVEPDALLSGLVVDEWSELVPDPFQTAGIGFHYDAPGARPPQSIVLALPPRLHQEHWTFDELLDVLHEAWDLAHLRGVRPSDLKGGLGILLPANYLPHSYTDDLPSVQVLKMQREARERLSKKAVAQGGIIALGKV